VVVDAVMSSGSASGPPVMTITPRAMRGLGDLLGPTHEDGEAIRRAIHG
jgi:hypothetical protein